MESESWNVKSESVWGKIRSSNNNIFSDVYPLWCKTVDIIWSINNAR